MNASFNEKSVWIQLVSVFIILGLYFIIAANMLLKGITEIMAFVPLFIAAVILLVAVLVAGHIVAAITNGPEGPDERERLIRWRAEKNSSWILSAGMLAAIACLVLSIDNVWIAQVFNKPLEDVFKYDSMPN